MATLAQIRNEVARVIGLDSTAAGTDETLFKIPSGLTTPGFVQLAEMTAPTGVANSGRLFVEDNGSGKSRLVVIFGSGAQQVLATEPP